MAHRRASADRSAEPSGTTVTAPRGTDLGNTARAELLTASSTETATPTLEAAAPERAPVIPSGTLGDVYRDHARDLPGMEVQPTSEHQWAMNHFKETYAENAERYAAVAEQTGVPAEMIAALHYRESSMQFDTYLHQGDPLGKKAVNHPNNIPVFDEWEEAAVHALNQKASIRDALGMDENTTDPAALATYAERYNGLGYHYKGKASPYVYSGTSVYTGGKYVRDGVYDPNVRDRQPGVMALMSTLQGEDGELPEWASPQTPDEAWGPVNEGHLFVRHGQRGPVIEALQDKLSGAGFEVGVDGDFGDKTKAALIEFQKANGLTPDGVVGPATAAALEAAGGLGEEDAPTEEIALEDAVTEEVPLEDAPTEEIGAPEAADPWAEAIAGGQMLRRGAAGDSVRELQQRLVSAGHGISVDGDFGPKTRAAVRAFQRAQGLTPDGIVGPATVAAMRG